MGKKKELKGKTIVLIACAASKRETRSKIRDLYTSPLFQYNLKWAEMKNPDKIFILSAKHKLIGLDVKVDPYNLTLNNMKSKEIKAWAEDVLEQLKEEVDLKKDRIVFLAGDKYRKYLIPHIPNYVIPLKGLGIGKQLGVLKRKTGGLD